MRQDTMEGIRHSARYLENIYVTLENLEADHVNHNEIHLLTRVLNRHIAILGRAIAYLQDTEREVKINHDTLSLLNKADTDLEVQTVGKLEPFRR